MTPPSRHGQTTTVPVIILPEVEFDFFEGQAVPEGFGKTEVPVRILPEVIFDFQPPEPVPALQLTLSLREGEEPVAEQLAVDLVNLYAAVDRLERGEGGAGLMLNDVSRDASGSDGKIRLCLRPTDPKGAEERLRQLVDRINQDAALIPALFERCEARIAA
jgi:hypothetical protein